MQNDMIDMLMKTAMYFIPFLLALSTHEYAHGWVANKLGDPTARLMGRLTLNPFAHADPIGTFAFPLIASFTGIPLFGWAKPVPVNDTYFPPKRRRFLMCLVALAGPGSNFILAFIGAMIVACVERFSPTFQYGQGVVDFAQVFLIINLFLALFNMIPIHPLDGGKIIAIFLPESVNRKLEEMAMFLNILLVILIFSGGLGRSIGVVVNILSNIMMMVAQGMVRLIP